MFICEKGYTCCDYKYWDSISNADVDCSHLVEVSEVVHGHWIAKMIPNGVSAFGVDQMTCEEEECSVCHKLYWVEEEKNYCPNCGAKMDEMCRNE